LSSDDDDVEVDDEIMREVLASNFNFNYSHNPHTIDNYFALELN